MELSSIGPMLRQMRNSRGYSQKEVVGLLGISQSALIDYEKGKSFPTLPLLFRLLALYNVPVEQVLREKLNPEGSPPDSGPNLRLLINKMLRSAKQSGKYSLSYRGNKYLVFIQTLDSTVVLSVSLHDGRFRKTREIDLKLFMDKSPQQISTMIANLSGKVSEAQQKHLQWIEGGQIVQINKVSGLAAEVHILGLEEQPIRIKPQDVPRIAEHYQKLGCIIYFAGFEGDG